MSKRTALTVLSGVLLVSSLTLTGCDSIDLTPLEDNPAAPGTQVEQINVAEDTNTKTDIASIAEAEALNFATTEEYFTDIAAVQAEGNVRFALSGSATAIVITASDSNYIITAVSQTGKVFVRTGDAATITEYADVAAYNAAPSPVDGLDKPVVG